MRGTRRAGRTAVGRVGGGGAHGAGWVRGREVGHATGRGISPTATHPCPPSRRGISPTVPKSLSPAARHRSAQGHDRLGCSAEPQPVGRATTGRVGGGGADAQRAGCAGAVFGAFYACSLKKHRVWPIERARNCFIIARRRAAHTKNALFAGFSPSIQSERSRRPARAGRRRLAADNQARQGASPHRQAETERMKTSTIKR